MFQKVANIKDSVQQISGAIKKHVSTAPAEKTISDIYFSCAKEGDLTTLKRFIEQEGINVNLRNKNYYGWTALHYAAEANNTVLIKYLLEHGADDTIQAMDSSTPLQWAQMRKKKEAIAILSGNYPTPADSKSNNNGLAFLKDISVAKVKEVAQKATTAASSILEQRKSLDLSNKPQEHPETPVASVTPPSKPAPVYALEDLDDADGNNDDFMTFQVADISSVNNTATLPAKDDVKLEDLSTVISQDSPDLCNTTNLNIVPPQTLPQPVHTDTNESKHEPNASSSVLLESFCDADEFSSPIVTNLKQEINKMSIKSHDDEDDDFDEFLQTMEQTAPPLVLDRELAEDI